MTMTGATSKSINPVHPGATVLNMMIMTILLCNHHRRASRLVAPHLQVLPLFRLQAGKSRQSGALEYLRLNSTLLNTTHSSQP
mmetsp:Transcript_35011/g.79206  ORF Transcript_35011/g.79206 Transcript_35011/m.79206 type:complete len:83 (+) Transcript_35011:204-452(+)